MDGNGNEERKPPYLPFKTFLGFVEGLAEKPLPPQIDRSVMAGKSGTDQANLFAAMKFFDLIDDANAVQPGLMSFAAADQEARKKVLTSLLRERYPNQFEVSDQHGTEKLLLDSFEEDFGFTGDTRRKAMTFFLHAARWAGMTLSAHFPTTRMGSGRTAASKPRRVTKKKTFAPPTADGQGQASEGSTRGEVVSVSFGDAGDVEVRVNVQWLALSDESFSELRRIIGELRSLGSPKSPDQTLLDETDEEEPN